MSAENPQQPHRPKQDGSELHYPCAGGSHSGKNAGMTRVKPCRLCLPGAHRKVSKQCLLRARTTSWGSQVPSELEGKGYTPKCLGAQTALSS